MWETSNYKSRRQNYIIHMLKIMQCFRQSRWYSCNRAEEFLVHSSCQKLGVFGQVRSSLMFSGERVWPEKSWLAKMVLFLTLPTWFLRNNNARRVFFNPCRMSVTRWWKSLTKIKTNTSVSKEIPKVEPITMEEGRESETEIFLRMELDSSGLFTARSFLIMSIFAFNCASFLMISRFLVRSQGQKQSKTTKMFFFNF